MYEYAIILTRSGDNVRLIDDKCPNCGARVEQKEEKILVCEYCGSQFDNALIITNEQGQLIVPPRPSLSLDVTLVLAMFLVFPGIIYALSVFSKQKKWDHLYGKTPQGMYYINSPRPQLSFILLFILFYFGIIPAIIYYTHHRKRLFEWQNNLAAIH